MPAQTPEAIAQEISRILPDIARKLLLDFFEKVNIPQSQLFAIVALHDCGPCKLTDLSRAMNVSAPTTTGIIDRLEKSGYVKRVPDAQDRRAITLSLTPNGISVAKKLRETLKERWLPILKKLPPEDAAKYLELLQTIRNA